MSAHFQHGSSSFCGEAPQCCDQDQRPNRSHASAAVLLRRHIQLLRDPFAIKSTRSTDAARLKRMGPCIATPDARQPVRMRGRSGLQRNNGLAAWQQLVLIAYMKKHIAQSISVRALARFVYLSSDGFRRAFKRSFGMPPRRYLTRQRIERAKELLAHSAWSVTAIGHALGFSQANSFSTAFRRVTGVSPTQYRQIQR
jgi:transcriptional regulator GlxA family with amidase domain